VREAVGDDVGGGVLVFVPQYGRGVGDDVAVGVIERDQHRMGGKWASVHQGIPQLQLRDRVVAVGLDPPICWEKTAGETVRALLSDGSSGVIRSMRWYIRIARRTLRVGSRAGRWSTPA
jgi:hypothetical protein